MFGNSGTNYSNNTKRALDCFAPFLLLIFIWFSSISYSVAASAGFQRGGDYKFWLIEAEKGDAEAQYFAGKYHQRGQGIFKNTQQSIEWFGKASLNGNLQAKGELARAYFSGDGLEKNPKESMRIWLELKNGGLTNAYNWLGMSYYLGVGVDKDYVRSALYFKEGADLGDLRAIFNLSLMYKNGYGVQGDYKQAELLLRESAELGYGPAQYNLSKYVSDRSESTQLVMKSAKQGYARSQYMLGHRYFEGDGIKQDPYQAYFWLMVSYYQGKDSAVEYANHVEQYLTMEEILAAREEAKRLSDSMLVFDVYEMDELINKGSS